MAPPGADGSLILTPSISTMVSLDSAPRMLTDVGDPMPPLAENVTPGVRMRRSVKLTAWLARIVAASIRVTELPIRSSD
jgi:hypothetical protein